jgi:hypothetical protein
VQRGVGINYVKLFRTGIAYVVLNGVKAEVYPVFEFCVGGVIPGNVGQSTNGSLRLGSKSQTQQRVVCVIRLGDEVRLVLASWCTDVDEDGLGNMFEYDMEKFTLFDHIFKILPVFQVGCLDHIRR